MGVLVAMVQPRKLSFFHYRVGWVSGHKTNDQDEAPGGGGGGGCHGEILIVTKNRTLSLCYEVCRHKRVIHDILTFDF